MTQTAVAQQKWAALKRGEQIIVDDDLMEILEQEPEANRLASLPNPRRIGVRDKYIAWLKRQQENVDRDLYLLHNGDSNVEQYGLFPTMPCRICQYDRRNHGVCMFCGCDTPSR